MHTLGLSFKRCAGKNGQARAKRDWPAVRLTELAPNSEQKNPEKPLRGGLKLMDRVRGPFWTRATPVGGPNSIWQTRELAQSGRPNY